MSERPRCGMCSKLIRPHTATVYAPTEPKTLRPVRDWNYTGNHRVVGREYAHYLVSPDGTTWVGRDDYKKYVDEYYAGWKPEKRLRLVYVWDGESYLPRDGFFCSATCAGDFARAAYKAGYRIRQRSAA